MALQGSGKISFSQIESEFGQNSERSLGDYRISDNGVAGNGGDANFANLPLDAGIPQSGEIKFSHFHGKRLNVFVDLYSKETTRINAYDRYINNTSKVKVVGELKGRPSNTSGTKVFIHVNKDVASEKGDLEYVALRTGNGWQSGTILSVDVGSSGGIYGAGGDGGKGRVCDGGESGKNGSSALGVEYNGTSVNVYSGGRIQAGFGGGGGGGGGHHDPDKNTKDHASSGGGGGGGAGLPFGAGGKAGEGAFGDGDDGGAGSDGTKTTGGGGGTGGDGGGSEGGDGGTGGAPGQNAGGGGDGAGNVCNSDGTGGGSNGSAIRKVSGVNFSLSNSGTVSGGTNDLGIK